MSKDFAPDRVEVCLHALARVAMQNGGEITFGEDEFRRRDFNIVVHQDHAAKTLTVKVTESRVGFILPGGRL